MDLLATRKPVWKALSTLYLDTELQEADYQLMVEALKKSAFSLSQLKEIDLFEVFPTLHYNLSGPAGEWAGFEETGLFEACYKNYQKKHSWVFRWTVKWRSVYFFYWIRKRRWEKLERLWESYEEK